MFKARVCVLSHSSLLAHAEAPLMCGGRLASQQELPLGWAGAPPPAQLPSCPSCPFLPRAKYIQSLSHWELQGRIYLYPAPTLAPAPAPVYSRLKYFLPLIYFLPLKVPALARCLPAALTALSPGILVTQRLSKQNCSFSTHKYLCHHASVAMTLFDG